MNLPPIRDFTRCAICGKKDGCKTVEDAHNCPNKIEIQQEKKLLEKEPVEWQRFIRKEREQPW
jgi:hypothetical protein